jgi:hypothetical protein
MTGTLKLPAFEILLRMSPLAAIQCLWYAVMTGEIKDLYRAYAVLEKGGISTNTFVAVLINGVLAFAQNISSFQTNKAVGALTITICANVKQCLTIILGIFIFHLNIGFWNAIGTLVTLGGVFWYSWIVFRTRKANIEIPK